MNNFGISLVLTLTRVDVLLHAGGWPEDAVELLGNDVVTRGANAQNDTGMAWTTSLVSRLRLFMSEPTGVTLTLNGRKIAPTSCEQLLEMLEDMPLFEDTNGLLAQVNERNPATTEHQRQSMSPIYDPFATGRGDPAIYRSGSGVSAVGIACADGSRSTGGGGGWGREGAGATYQVASMTRTGRPTFRYRGPVRV